jgi:uncharacterized membrane protein YraQ (UPF0718 family)
MMGKKPKRDYSLMFFSLIAIVFVGIAWQRGGYKLVLGGFTSGSISLLSVIPLLIAAFLTTGFVQVLVDKEKIEKWLGSNSGWRGLMLACLGGAIIPGGPYVYYPIAGALLNTGAGIGVLVVFITAKNLWSVSRLPMEIALLGPELTTIRFGITLGIPPLLGFLSEVIFGRFIDRIREGVPE